MDAVRDPQRYRLSFTVGTLYLSGAPLAAQLHRDLGDWIKVREALRSENLLQARTSASSILLSRELTHRLSTFSPEELEIITDATVEELAQLMWVAVCRRYSFIGEFAEEGLRERFLLMQTDLTTEHFDAFVREKALWHDELTNLEASTLKKLRANLFKMLREAGLITEASVIIPTILATRVHEQLTRRVPSDIRFFPTRETS
ncbi:DUF1819 family protein [Microbacterium profundi]|uniref:DUF1819 family protein n=1 Tax=Microbacterium profundi TaxID=450380 RepID=A0ABV3LI18_9MICO